MATSGVSGSLAVSGLLSGLSTNDIISKMLEAEAAPATLMVRQRDTEQRKKDAIRDLNTRLASLLTTVRNLNLQSTIDAKTVRTDTASSSATIVTATAGSGASIGSFTVKVVGLATATSVTSDTGSGPEAIGSAVQANQTLATAGFMLAPTTGTFAVNGATVTIDSSTVLDDGVNNVGANTVIAKIRDATSGLAADKQVTASLVADDNGRLNKLALTATGAIQLGSGSDTSNFLTATGLAALPPSTSMTGTRNLGGTNTGEVLDSGNLDVALSAATGSFKINGVSISYDADVDTLNTMINRINSSAAKVTAAYDAVNDRLTITARNTGGATITLEDVSGNFLTAMKLSASNESVGDNASYLLNGQQMYSTSNTVSNVLPGISLNLVKEDATIVTLTVSQDTSGAVSAVQSFVAQFNSTIDAIRAGKAWDAKTKTGGILMGDSTITGIENSLRSLVTGMGDGLGTTVRSFSDIGITTGAVGSVVGSTNDLVLDTAKLTTQLQSNPSAVANLFGGLVSSATLEPAGTGSIASITGVPNLHVAGTYSVASDAVGNLTSIFTPATGGQTITKTVQVAQAGNMETLLIPGLGITTKGAFVAGTDTITTAVTMKGVGTKLADYLQSITSSTGALSTKEDSEAQRIDDMNKSLQRMQDRLATRERDLKARFAALEGALATLQNQSSALSAQLSQFYKE